MKNNSQVSGAKIGKDTRIWNFVNLYKCEIGRDCIVGSFTEIQEGVVVGNKSKIESHTFICSGVTIEEEVFIGHHVVFVNDKYPRAVNKEGRLKTERDWSAEKIVVKKNASIGSNSTILGGITIGERSIVGAGSVVTKNVPPDTIVAGNPARELRRLK